MSEHDKKDDDGENTVRQRSDDAGVGRVSVKPSVLPTEPLAPPSSPRLRKVTGEAQAPRKITGESPAVRRPTGEPTLDPTVVRKPTTGESPPLRKPSDDSSAASTPRDESFLEATAVRKPAEPITPRDESFLEATAVRKPTDPPARPPPQIESLSFLEPTAPRKKSPGENFASDHPSVRLEAPIRVETDPLIGQMLGEYRVLAPLGKGGQGVVYRGEQPVINRPVAIKVLKKEFANDPKNARRFLEEARSVSAARHPGIIDIFSFGETPAGEPYLVMELLEGEPLDVLLRRRGTLPEKEVIALLIPMLNALSSAHAAGVIHRDLKPGNVFVVKLHDGTTFPKVLDFGLARRGEAGAARVRQTSVGGTPLYVAPEQVRGEAVGPQTDLYSLGCLAYELLAGRPPFYEGNLQQLLDQHLKLAPKPLRPGVTVSADLEQLILRCLEKDLTARPSSALEVREQLEKLRDVALAPTRKLPKTVRSVSKENMQTVRMPTLAESAAPATTATIPRQSAPRPFPLKAVVGALALIAAIVVAVVIAKSLESAPPTQPVISKPAPIPEEDDLQPLAPVKPEVEEPVAKPAPQPEKPEPITKPDAPIAKPDPKPPRSGGAHTSQDVKERWKKLNARAKALSDESIRRMALLQLDDARQCNGAPDVCWSELSEIEETFFKK